MSIYWREKQIKTDSNPSLIVSTSPEKELTHYGRIKTAEQRTTIQQYGDWYTGHWWVGCYIWYSDEGPGRAAAPPSQ